MGMMNNNLTRDNIREDEAEEVTIIVTTAKEANEIIILITTIATAVMAIKETVVEVAIKETAIKEVVMETVAMDTVTVAEVATKRRLHMVLQEMPIIAAMRVESRSVPALGNTITTRVVIIAAIASMVDSSQYTGVDLAKFG